MSRLIGVISLGCAKNLVDSEHMTGLLRAAGHRFTANPAEADVLIVNTCGFIEPAKQEAINTLLEMARYKETGRCRLLIATGCLVQRYRDELRDAMPELDILLGVNEYEKLPALLADTPDEAAVCGPAERALLTPPYRAYLRIADGCNNRCAYCAIPLIRGPLHSTPAPLLIAEAKRLAERGVTELSVIAQDTSGYGVDLYGKPMLCELLEQLSDIDGLKWIRLLYTYPDTVTPRLIDTLRKSDRLVRYFDMPLQHIDDTVLRRMNRRGDERHIRSVLDYIKENAPDFTLRTTMMTGFPGETDAAFEKLLRFLAEYRFDRVGAFAFSAEEGTRAASMPDQVPEPVRKERLERLMLLQRSISAKRNAARIGEETELLIERFAHGYAHGRTPREAPDVDGETRIRAIRGCRIGQYVPIRLTAAEDYDMIGEAR